MNTTQSPADRPTYSDPAPVLYGFPLAVWRIPIARMGGLTALAYAEAYEVLTDPHGHKASLWEAELEEEGYKVLTQNLTLPQVVSLVSELPQRTIVRLTGRAPADATRQEVVRMLYTEPED